MIKGLDNFVYLEPISHRYFDLNGLEYMSGSRFIGLFCKKFDSNMVAGQVAKSTGVKKQDVLDQWQAKTDEGTRRHNAIELYFKTTTIRPEDEDLRPMILNIVFQYREYYRVYNEVILYDKDELIAGTADSPLVCTSSPKSVIDIGDFKNYGRGINQKEVDKEGNPRNEYMLGPLSHLQNSSYNKVSLQLSLYAYMLQKQTGRKIGKLFAHWISPENPLINTQIPCAYMKYEIEAMIKWKRENPILIETPEPASKNLNHIKSDWDL